MFVESDTRKNVALNILHDELKLEPLEVSRFTIGYCHNVYYVETKAEKYVLRITGEESKHFYLGSIKWLSELSLLEIPVPKILEHGQHKDVYYVLMTYILGKDLGEIYHTLDDLQKCTIVKSLVGIQKKISTLPPNKEYGYGYNSFNTWIEFLESLIERSRKRITKNNVFDTVVCDNVFAAIDVQKDYLMNVEPLAFLDDITTKNVLVQSGKLVGIVDVDEICYGDSLLTVGLTNMSLLAMKSDTKYIDFWLDELQATSSQRKAVMLYTLLYCIDFMGEQGMTFDNDNTVVVSSEKVMLLKSIFHNLLDSL